MAEIQRLKKVKNRLYYILTIDYSKAYDDSVIPEKLIDIMKKIKLPF